MKSLLKIVFIGKIPENFALWAKLSIFEKKKIFFFFKYFDRKSELWDLNIKDEKKIKQYLSGAVSIAVY